MIHIPQYSAAYQIDWIHVKKMGVLFFVCDSKNEKRKDISFSQKNK